MYCSLRIYADKIADSISAQNILSLFDLFGSIFGWSYDYISYMLFDPDADYMLIDKSYTYDSRGKKDFSDTNINAVFVGKYGESSAPIITASCTENAVQLYSKHRIQIQYPISSEPYITTLFNCYALAVLALIMESIMYTETRMKQQLLMVAKLASV